MPLNASVYYRRALVRGCRLGAEVGGPEPPSGRFAGTLRAGQHRGGGAPEVRHATAPSCQQPCTTRPCALSPA